MILADPALIVLATGSIFACDLNGTVPAQPADPASVRSQWNFVDTDSFFMVRQMRGDDWFVGPARKCRPGSPAGPVC